MCKFQIGDKRLNVSYAVDVEIDWDKEADKIKEKFKEELKQELIEQLKREFQYPEISDSVASVSTCSNKKAKKKEKIQNKRNSSYFE
jgi:hypothetical protein